MKKIFKKGYIFSFILGAIVFGSVGVYASNILASDITYKDTNVEDALDELYDKTHIFDNMTLVKDFSQGAHSRSGDISLSFNAEENQEYYVIGTYVATDTTTSTSTCGFSYDKIYTRLTYGDDIEIIQEYSDIGVQKIKALKTGTINFTLHGAGANNNAREYIDFKIYK